MLMDDCQRIGGSAHAERMINVGTIGGNSFGDGVVVLGDDTGEGNRTDVAGRDEPKKITAREANLSPGHWNADGSHDELSART